MKSLIDKLSCKVGRHDYRAYGATNNITYLKCNDCSKLIARDSNGKDKYYDARVTGKILIGIILLSFIIYADVLKWLFDLRYNEYLPIRIILFFVFYIFLISIMVKIIRD